MDELSRGRGHVFGRSNEFDAVRAGLGGVGGVVLIEGEAGIGKTTFLAEVLAEPGSGRVVQARADELDGTRPFGALVDALECRRSSADPLSAEIAQLIDEAAAEFRIVQRFSERIERLALAGPLVVAIDDLQWADPSTVTALSFSTRQLRDVPVTFVVAFRPVPRDDTLRQFLDAARRDGALHVTLGPLDEGAVAELVEDRLGLPPGPGLQALVTSAGGNPFYVTELIDALAFEGTLRVAERVVDADVTSTPPAFRSAIVRYVRFLGEPRLTLLRWAAVLGSRFSPTDLASVSGTALNDLLPVLDDAARAGIFTDDGTRLAFRHDLLQAALYDDMGVAIRASLHLEAARALAAAGASPLDVAYHIMRTPPTADDFAAGTLLAAADQTIHMASKIELLLAAHARFPADDTRSVPTADRSMVMLGMIGRAADAERFAASLPATLGAHDRARLHAALAMAYANQGDGAATLRHCGALRDRTLLTPASQTLSLITEGFAHLEELRIDDAETLGRRAIAEATAANERHLVAPARGLLCFCMLARGDNRDATTMAVDVARTWPGQGDFALQVALINDDRFDDAEAFYASTHEPIAERGYLTVQLRLQAANARAALLAGRLDDAEARCEAALLLAEQTVADAPVGVARGVRGRVALHRGDVTAAAAALGPDEPVTGLGADLIEWVRALLLDAEGDPDEARRYLASSWERLESVRFFGSWPGIGSDLVRLHIRAGDRIGAAKVIEAIEFGAAGCDAPSAAGAALCSRALVERDPAVMRNGLTMYAAGPRRLETAKAREDAASFFDDAEAIAQLREALATYEGAGALGDVTRVRAALRQRGVSLGTRGPRERSSTGWSSITPAEHRVVALVAEGLTTRQIGDRLHISSFTVGSHLRHVYQKLGINSRVQLTREAIKHGPPIDDEDVEPV